jgi:hypothetical protein
VFLEIQEPVATTGTADRILALKTYRFLKLQVARF